MRLLILSIICLPLMGQETPCRYDGDWREGLDPDCTTEQTSSTQTPSPPTSQSPRPSIANCNPPPQPATPTRSCQEEFSGDGDPSQYCEDHGNSSPTPPPPLPAYCQQGAWSWFPAEGTVGITCPAGTDSINGPDREGRRGTYCVPQTGCIPSSIWLPNNLALGRSCCESRAERNNHYCRTNTPSPATGSYGFSLEANSCVAVLDESGRSYQDFQKSERITLAFEYLFSTVSQYDNKYGFLNKLSQTANNLKEKRSRSMAEYRGVIDGISVAETDAFGIESFKIILKIEQAKNNLYSKRIQEYPLVKNLINQNINEIGEFNWREKPWWKKNACNKWFIIRVKGENHLNCYSRNWQLHGSAPFHNLQTFLTDQTPLSSYPSQCLMDPVYPGGPPFSPPSLSNLRSIIKNKLGNYNIDLETHGKDEQENTVDPKAILGNTALRSLLSYGRVAGGQCNQASAHRSKIAYLRQVIRAIHDVMNYYQSSLTISEGQVIPCLESQISDLLKAQDPTNTPCPDCEPSETEVELTPSVTQDYPEVTTPTPDTNTVEAEGPHPPDRQDIAVHQNRLPTDIMNSLSLNPNKTTGIGYQEGGLPSGGSSSVSNGANQQGQGAFHQKKSDEDSKEGKNQSLTLDDDRDKDGSLNIASRSPAGKLSLTKPSPYKNGEQFGHQLEYNKGSDEIIEEDDLYGSIQPQYQYSPPSDHFFQENDLRENGGHKNPPTRYPSNSPEAQSLKNNARSVKKNERDTLWQRINKAYEREAHPVMLIKRTKNIAPKKARQKKQNNKGRPRS